MRNYLMLFLLLLCLGSVGQKFVTPLEAEDINQIKSALVTSNDDSEFVGVKFGTYILNNGMLSSFTLKSTDGEKRKFKAADVKSVKLETNGLVKAMVFADNISLNKVIRNDYSFMDNMDYVFYEKVEVKAGKYKLLQLLNPGFDEYIKVYLDPNAKESTQYGSGKTSDKSFYVKKGDQAFLLKKKNYKKEFVNLFGDCQVIMDMVDSDEVEVKFKEFPLHIAIYNENQ